MKETLYIGNITLKSLRNAILDYRITERDSILLHQENFDSIALEYRETYKENLPYPFFYLGVFVNACEYGLISIGKIEIKRMASVPNRNVIENEELYPPFDCVYRCGWCGNVVDFDGALLDPKIRQENIRVLEKFGNDIRQIKVHGKCCADKH